MRVRVLAAVSLLACAGAAVAAETVELRLLVVNDFHGALESAPYAFANGEKAGPAGGALALAQAIERERAGARNSLLVSSGDLFGASPLPSALAKEEPTVALFNHLGLQANAIGNHELDGGLDELRRLQSLAKFPFLSANLVDARSGVPAFAPYRIVEVDGVRVAFVGATVRNALKPLEPDSVVGLRLDDEVEALNAQAALLRAQGVHALVALLHEGAGAQEARIDDASCDSLAGPARDMVVKLDPEYDLVLTAHTHAIYTCPVGGRWLLQSGANGRELGVADLRLDREGGDVVAVAVRNEQVRPLPKAPLDAEVSKIVAGAVAAAAKIAEEPIASLPAASVSAVADDEGGSPLGRLVASAQLEAGKALGAEMACTNPSSVPRDLVASQPGHTVSYADVRRTQPYGNRLKVRRVTGAQLRALLAQQYREGAAAALLSCAPSLEYRAGDAGRPRIGGRLIGNEDTLVMVVNSYLARGGQGFSALIDTPELGDAGTDLDALLAWLRAKH